MKISWLIPLLMSGFIYGSCNNKRSEDSGYSDILSQRPFATLTDSIRDNPDNDSLYFRRAILLNSNNFLEPALVDFKKAWSLKKNEEYAFGLGNILLEKKPDSAIVFLRQALKVLPQSFLLNLTLARALLAQNKIDDALAISDQLLKENPDQVDVMKMKADILDRKGNKTDAISTLIHAYNLTPHDVELNYMLALRLAENGNSRLVQLCDSLIKADSLGIHAEPYYYKGIFYSTKKDYAQALALFDHAIQRNFYFLDAYIEKGALLFEMKKYQDALAVFNLCLNVSPKFADAYYWIAKTQQATGLLAEAKLNYQRAYSLDNQMTEAKQAADKLK